MRWMQLDVLNPLMQAVCMFSWIFQAHEHELAWKSQPLYGNTTMANSVCVENVQIQFNAPTMHSNGKCTLCLSLHLTDKNWYSWVLFQVNVIMGDCLSACRISSRLKTVFVDSNISCAASRRFGEPIMGILHTHKKKQNIRANIADCSTAWR